MSFPSSDALHEVRIADGRLRVWHPVDPERDIALADVSSVWIETDDSGPWGNDVRWVIVAGADTVVVPLGATGEDGLLAWIQSLPGVDNEAIIEAMGSTTIGRYPVWTRA